MRLARLLGTVGLWAGLVGAPAAAEEPSGFANLTTELQPPPAPSATQPPPATLPRPGQTRPPTAPRLPATPPTAPTAPAATTPLTQAPVTNVFAQAPQTGTTAGPSQQPFMIGDLIGGSYVQTFVHGLPPQRSLQSVLPPTPPPSTGNPNPTPTPLNPGQIALLTGTSRILMVPAAGRGPFKIDENESPRPMDRVFINYNYFNGVGRSIFNVPAFDVHQETIGFEKTFLDGDASVGLRVPTVQQNGDGSLSSRDFGDMTIVTKFALLNNRNTGDILTGGLAVTVPTGPDLMLLDGTRLNPVLLQPYTGFIYNFERLYAHGFSSLVIPTDPRDVLLSTGSLGLGYRLYQAEYPEGRLISSLTPTVEGHATVPLNHRGLDSTPTGFPDLFVLTQGVHVGLGARSLLTTAIAVPLTGPRPFAFEAIAQLNFRF